MPCRSNHSKSASLVGTYIFYIWIDNTNVFLYILLASRLIHIVSVCICTYKRQRLHQKQRVKFCNSDKNAVLRIQNAAYSHSFAFYSPEKHIAHLHTYTQTEREIENYLFTYGHRSNVVYASTRAHKKIKKTIIVKSSANHIAYVKSNKNRCNDNMRNGKSECQ